MHEPQKVKEQILRYLKANPLAGDTREGIARWWLLRQQVTDTFNVIQQAIDDLIREQRVVERRSGRGEPMYFAAAPERLSEPR